MSSGHRRWAEVSEPPGRMINHPAVLADLQHEGVSTETQTREYDGITVVTYRRPRFYLDRVTWEALAPDDVLLMRVRPNDGHEAFDLALTREELNDAFGYIKATRSWATKRHYHSDPPPRAASRFRVIRTASGLSLK